MPTGCTLKQQEQETPSYLQKPVKYMTTTPNTPLQAGGLYDTLILQSCFHMHSFIYAL